MTAPTRRESLAGGFTRRGACPALSAPMQTGDGLLVRLNPVDGGLSPNMLIGLCKAALGHGNGIVEVTSRGSLQIRGLTPHSAAALALDVDRLGISVRTGIPVQTGALAGLDPHEISDPSALADALRAGIAGAGLDVRLGPKVSVVVDGGGRSMLEDVAADVRLTAVRDGLWQVAVAGDTRTAEIVGFARENALEETLALLAAIAAKGVSARARDLTAEETAGAIEAAKSSFTPPSVLPKECEPTNRPTLFTVHSLTDNRHALGVALPFGQTTAETLIALAQAAENLGVSDIRLAPRRTLIALCPSTKAAETLRQTAENLDLITSPSDPRQHISACPGAPACASGYLPARSLAAQIASDFAALEGSLHISGCAKGCAHPGKADITIVGSENGAGIVVAGTARDVPLAYTAHAKSGLVAVATLLRGEAARGESTRKTLSRLGPAAIVRVFE